MPLCIGDIAPAISLPNQDGIEVSLKDFSNQWVVIYFYPKDNTPGCTTQACDFNSLFSSFNDLGVSVLGISPDGIKSHQKFIAKYDLRLTLLCDEEHIALKAYEAWGLKKLYGREYEGVIRSTYIINPDGKIAKIYNNVRAKGHANIIKEELSSLISK